jgi:formate-dependent nitrite reductase membrane component NrfD
VILAEHFTAPPEWRWYILVYFVLAGLAGGCFVLATLFRFTGYARDEEASRLGFYLSFPLLVACPIVLTADLGQPLRFWHMVFDTGAAGPGLNFRYWSPMSLGVWVLAIFAIFSLLAFLHVLASDGRFRNPLTRMLIAAHSTVLGKAFDVVGSVVALFFVSYTGVLLSVSNQPVWSDSFAIGGLFLASGLTGAAALLGLATRWRPAAAEAGLRLSRADGYFAALELAFILVFWVTLALAGTLGLAFGSFYSLLWLLAILGVLPPLAGMVGRDVRVAPGGGSAGAAHALTASTTVGAVAVLVGSVALRAAVIWSAQG